MSHQCGHDFEGDDGTVFFSPLITVMYVTTQAQKSWSKTLN